MCSARIVFFTILFTTALSTFGASTAVAQVPEAANLGPATRHHALIGNVAFNRDDACVDLRYRYAPLPMPEIGVFANVGGRFWEKTRTFQVAENRFRVVKETRYFVALGVDGTFELAHPVALFAAAAGAYAWGDYKGISTSAESGWTPMAEVGLELSWYPAVDRGFLRIGYQYADFQAGPTNWAYVGVGVRL